MDEWLEGWYQEVMRTHTNQGLEIQKRAADPTNCSLNASGALYTSCLGYSACRRFQLAHGHTQCTIYISPHPLSGSSRDPQMRSARLHSKHTPVAHKHTHVAGLTRWDWEDIQTWAFQGKQTQHPAWMWGIRERHRILRILSKRGNKRHEVGIHRKSLREAQNILSGLNGEGVSLPKPVSKNWKRWQFLQMQRQQHNTSWKMKKEKKMKIVRHSASSTRKATTWTYIHYQT